MICNKKRKSVFIKWKWNHVIFSRATISSFHPVVIITNKHLQINDILVLNNPFRVFIIKCFRTIIFIFIVRLAERIQKICSPYDIRTVFTSGSTLQRYLFRVKPPTDFNMIKNCIYSIPCSCGKIYIGETGHPLKVRLEEHWKAVV